METYIYCADIYCEDCGQAIKSDLSIKGPLPDVLDSDCYPQGPYEASEADSPQHCADCGEFLENPLTEDGNEYVKDYIKNAPGNPVTQIWADYYDYLT